MHPRILLIMAILHFVAMYLLMYVMVNVTSNIFFNLNNVYMAGMMTAPMLLIEGILMRSMYENKQMLNMIMVGSAFVMILLFLFVRRQTAIGDTEFLRSMIPHHSGAILMCQQAQIQNPEIKTLCQNIIRSQQDEIDQMKNLLKEH